MTSKTPRLAQTVAAVTLVAVLSACGASSPPATVPAPHATAEKEAKAAIAREQSLDIATAPTHSVGIPPFLVHAADSSLAALGYGLADLLTTDLARSGQLQIVDRIRLDAVLREIHLVKSGRVDTATAPRVGKLVQARRLVLGGLSEAPAGTLAIEARIADVATGEVRQAVAASAPLENILRAEKALAFRLFDQLEVNLTPTERALVEQLPTQNVTAFLAYSRGVRYEAEGRFAEAREAYDQAVQLDPGFREARQHLDDLDTQAEVIGTPVLASHAPVDKVVAGINGPFLSPLGSQHIAPPGTGGGDVQLPTRVVIIIERPR